MSPRKITNLPRSLRERLKNLSRSRGLDFQATLRGFLYERFLYRLGRSELKERFVLKGAMLLRVWTDQPYRSTVDLDLLRRGAPDREAIGRDLLTICSTLVEPDGVELALDTKLPEYIREEQEHAGVRARVVGKLDTAVVPLQIDIGTGDAVWPKPTVIEYPGLLELPRARVLGYPRETVVAEKLEAMVVLGILNTRIKDHFDIHHLATHHPFDGAMLAKAIQAVFARRSTEFPAAEPVALTDEFWSVTEREIHVRAFARRARIDADLASARALLPLLRAFLLPPLSALKENERFSGSWPAGGPWRDLRG